MFLATTALSEFWETREELLFLGPWCLRYSRRGSWEKLKPRVLADPWNDQENSRRALAEASAAYENLLKRLADRLNQLHGTGHSLRYWRILLGPWLLGYVSSFCDRSLHLRAALKDSPGLRTTILDPRDYGTPRDTAQANLWRASDRFNLQIYSQAIAHLGLPAETRRLPPSPLEPAAASRWKAAATDALFRIAIGSRVRGPHAYFSDLYLDRIQTLRLIAASKFQLRPVLKQLPPDFRFEPLDSPERRGLASPAPGSPSGLESLLVSALPAQLPTLFLEGYPALRKLVLGDWPRLPENLVTSVGFFYNEYFKLLAAESTERDGRLVIAQHGGGYGMQEMRDNERHERAVADLYATWGWKDDFAPGAELTPLPSPRLMPCAPRHGGSSGGDWLMICGTLPRYPYSWWFADKGAASRFGESLDWRLRFIESLPEPLRRRLLIRLHHADLGWDQRPRLEERFPRLRFDSTAQWTKRPDLFGLVLIDHPQTSMLEALALNVPTLLFWDPELWPLRPSAQAHFDDLRQAGILLDSPEAAAARAVALNDDPTRWWRSEPVQEARARFCRNFACGSRDWDEIWSRRLGPTPARPEISS